MGVSTFTCLSPVFYTCNQEIQRYQVSISWTNSCTSWLGSILTPGMSQFQLLSQILSPSTTLYHFHHHGFTPSVKGFRDPYSARSSEVHTWLGEVCQSEYHIVGENRGKLHWGSQLCFSVSRVVGIEIGVVWIGYGQQNSLSGIWLARHITIHSQMYFDAFVSSK